MHRLRLLVGLLLAALALVGVTAPAGASGPRPAAAIDLAGTWDFAPDVGVPTTITVPGGGWYKQGHIAVKQATYSRSIAVPESAAGQTVMLELGAVNHEATVKVDDKLVGVKTTSFTPQAFDLTRFVTPGKTHRLSVHVKGRDALVQGPRPATPSLPGVPTGAIGGGYLVPDGGSWSESIPQGIFASARLAIYPPVQITDAFVRPSVAKRELAYDVWVRNATDRPQTASIAARLAGANTKRRFNYPELPVKTVELAAGETRKITVSGVAWDLGTASYWWPNVPYRRGHRAQLHTLRLDLETASGIDHEARYRFGFREMRQVRTHYELNGVRVNLRGDSLALGMYDRIDHGGKGDAAHTLPGFLPPSAGNPGWPKAVDNFKRLNMNVVRVHQEPFSRYMLDVADAMGLMLIDETAIRGSESKQDFVNGRVNFVNHARDLVLRDRNHASVVRWSQSNEPDANANGDPVDFEQELLKTILAHDGTRPVSIDVTSKKFDEIVHPQFTTYQHYVNEDGSIGGWTDSVHPRTDRPFGRGEFIWPINGTPQGFAWFATTVEKMRERDAAEIRPYSLAGAWASSIPGVKRTDFLSDSDTPPLYGEDNLPDPWGNHIIRRIQKGFHPLLVADRDYWEAHKLSDPAGRWPGPTASTLRAGEKTTRNLVVFNDTLSGDEVAVSWSLREGAADGPVVERGSFERRIALGSRATVPVSFTPPADAAGKRLHLVLEASKPGQRRAFRDGDQYFLITP